MAKQILRNSNIVMYAFLYVATCKLLNGPLLKRFNDKSFRHSRQSCCLSTCLNVQIPLGGTDQTLSQVRGFCLVGSGPVSLVESATKDAATLQQETVFGFRSCA